MSRMKFTKMEATGNDFVVIDSRVKGGGCPSTSLGAGRVEGYSKLARVLCERKTGVGADGVLVIEKSRKTDFKMRIFNADGSEAEMCGNGLRCAALQVHKCTSAQVHKFEIETKAGIYETEITGKDSVKVKMAEPEDIKLNLLLLVNSRRIKVNFINTGVPHTVIFVNALQDIDVENIGRTIRYHKTFKPKGTNVDFVEIVDERFIKMRTYERGVEGETSACGTGAVAAAIITALSLQLKTYSLQLKINVHVKGGVLKVSFKLAGNKIKDVYLEGEAKEVFTGEVTYV